LLLLGGCAEVPTDPEGRAIYDRVNDPLEPMNRSLFAVNNFIDDNFMVPVAEFYRDFVPKSLRDGIHNFLVNLNAPFVAGNEILQGRPAKAAVDLGRFVINSTFGVAGIWDVVADHGGPLANDTDIGLTFGIWGLEAGPYLVLPLLGPSGPRDLAGVVAHFWTDPANSVITIEDGHKWAVDTRTGLTLLDTRTRYLEPLANLQRTSLDYYAALRSAYRQTRQAGIDDH
jgi:phospholipid-binding lipoprotein MlaA